MEHRIKFAGWKAKRFGATFTVLSGRIGSSSVVSLLANGNVWFMMKPPGDGGRIFKKEEVIQMWKVLIHPESPTQFRLVQELWIDGKICTVDQNEVYSTASEAIRMALEAENEMNT